MVLSLGCGGGGGTSANPDPRLEMVDLINAERSSHGLASLTHNLALSQVAQAHADDMIARNFFDHTNPDSHDFVWRVQNAGITFSLLAENIAAGYHSMADTHTEFMNSPSHRDNILNSSVQQVGIGYAWGKSTSLYGQGLYVVELFMKP